jgi:hypothetical protein
MTIRQFVDDPTIPDAARLFHRVHLSFIVPGQGGEARISSGLFRKKTELSIVIESVLAQAGRQPEDCLRNYPLCKLVALTAAICRQNQQVVVRDPAPEEPAHGIVFGNKTHAIASVLSLAAEWVVPSPPPRYAEIEAERRRKNV